MPDFNGYELQPRAQRLLDQLCLVLEEYGFIPNLYYLMHHLGKLMHTHCLQLLTSDYVLAKKRSSVIADQLVTDVHVEAKVCGQCHNFGEFEVVKAILSA